MTLRNVFWMTGPSQSNGWGVNAGETGADIAAVPYWDTEIDVSASTELHSLTGAASGGHGKDYTIGKQLLAFGYNPIIVNISEGSTYSYEWIPPPPTQHTYDVMVSEVTAAWAAIQTAFPGDTFAHHHVSDQGEAEARYDTLSIVQAWSSNYAASHAALEGLVGASMSRWVFMTHSVMNGKTFPGVLEAQQLAAAGSKQHLIDRNDLAWESNGVHLQTAGYIACGQRFVSQFMHVNTPGVFARPPDVPPDLRRRPFGRR